MRVRGIGAFGDQEKVKGIGFDFGDDKSAFNKIMEEVNETQRQGVTRGLVSRIDYQQVLAWLFSQRIQ